MRAMWWATCCTSMPPTGEPCRVVFPPGRILAEERPAPDAPLALLSRLLRPATPPETCATAPRALLDLPALPPRPAPSWLTPHQVPACERLQAIVSRYGGAVLADAVGLGESYVALAVAAARAGPFALIVPAVLAPQWRRLLHTLGLAAPIISHESLSRERAQPRPPGRLFVIDEAHHFRNPDTRRYRALARLVIGARVLLVTATPVHNRIDDLLHLCRLFLRDDALTGLGVPSLRRAARGDRPEATTAALSRLVVARSRRRVLAGYRHSGAKFPARGDSQIVRASPADVTVIQQLTDGIRRLHPTAAGAPLVRLSLLRRLASSIPALRETMQRYASFLDLAADAASGNRRLTLTDFRTLFPSSSSEDLQLALWPVLLDDAGPPLNLVADRRIVRELLPLTSPGVDPKADALERLLSPADKTIVFVSAVPTLHQLRRRLSSRHRVAALEGATGWFGCERATRREVLQAFAPQAQGVSAPPAALVVHVLLATDLLSEGLNLQDARRVVHYDLPWSPARLAQRVGRIDRLASPHPWVETVTFLPAEPLLSALAFERRLADKIEAQRHAGAAEVETIHGAAPGDPMFDWCDRLQALIADETGAADGVGVAVPADADAVVLVIRFGALVECLVAADGEVRADPALATAMLEQAAVARTARNATREEVLAALRLAGPLVRERLTTAAA